MRNGFRRAFGILLLCLLLIGLGLLVVPAPEAEAAAVEPTLVEGNATCGSLDSTWVEFHKVEPVTDGGVWPAGDAEMRVAWDAYVTDGGQAIAWTASFPIMGVFVKGGPGGNLYRYASGSVGDQLLHAPENSSGGWAGLSHVSFCYLQTPPTTPTLPPPTEPTTPPSQPTVTPPPTPPRSLLGEIGDFVWEDADGDGIQEPGEKGVKGVVVNLLQSGLVVAQTVTDDAGKYLFGGLLAGEYEVQFVLPAGFEFTRLHEPDDDAVDSDAAPATGRTGPISLSAGERDHTWDAGIVRPAQVLPQVVTTAATVVETLPFTGPPDVPGLAGLATAIAALGGMAVLSITRKEDQPISGWSRRLP
ncbi:MAG TPA: SdrD B-like domain-containing protein [Acidimicrobiia bacterium]|nr:SdrD B-like domain-containing protein [Acidimicrobiia bacterium]